MSGYICTECRTEFDGVEATVKREPHGEDLIYCPNCGSSHIDDLVRCESCDDPFCADELVEGTDFCADCYTELEEAGEFA